MNVGEVGVIRSLCPSVSGIENRLNALGFARGNTVMCTMKSPLGDPHAYLIKGSVIALRKSEAEAVTVCADEDTGDGHEE